MNIRETALKHKQHTGIIIVIAAMLAILLSCYVFNGISKKYTEYSVDNTQYEDYNGNRIDSLELSNGILTSENDINFMVIGDRKILDSPIKTITINVSYLSCEPVKTALYVLDTYEKYDFTLEEGKNTIVLKDKDELNNGENPSLIRIDLLNKTGESVKVDSVIFNEKEECYKAVLISKEIAVYEIFTVFMLLFFSLYLIKYGRSRTVPYKRQSAVVIAAAAVCAVIYKVTGNNILVFGISAIILMRLIWIIYYYLTVNIIDKIKNIDNNIFSVFSVLVLILLFLLYMTKGWLFGIFAFYPVYLIGYYGGNIRIEKVKRSLFAVISVLCLSVLMSIILHSDYKIGIYNEINISALKIYLFTAAIAAEVIAVLINAAIRSGYADKNILNCLKTGVPFMFAYGASVVCGIKLTFPFVFLSFCIISLLAVIVCIVEEKINEKETGFNSCKGEKLFEKSVIRLIIIEVFLVTLLLLFEAVVRFMLLNIGVTEVYEYIVKFVFSPVFLYNMLLINIVYFTFVSLSGIGLGSLIFAVINGLLFLANFIKLKYHNSLFKPGDLLQIGDFLNIVKTAIRIRHMILIVLAVVIIIVVVYKFRKYFKIFKPEIKIISLIFMVVALYGTCRFISDNKLNDIGITTVDKWLDDEIKTERQGFYIYTYFNLLTIKDIFPSAPDGYSKETIDSYKEIFNSMELKTGDDIKPDVIMLMQESVFDIESVPGLVFSEEVEKNIKQFKKLDMVSPRFGGGTANVEFEALTGLSTYFMADNVVPYVTYWTNEDNHIPSIVQQFDKNGYETVAIHPNDGSFYNREIVYKDMGFDNFVSIEDMDPNIKRNKRSYVLNTEMLKVIKNELEKNDEPKFMFALNIENHNPYDVKETDADIEITGNISKSAKNEAEVYSHTLKNDDTMIGEMIEYVKNAKRPTILYVWGDHLPMINVLVETGYINDVENKYKTPVIMYSNYKELNADVPLYTPNQLAVQAIMDSGIKHSSYFNYIYSLRGKYPVIHKEFGIDPDAEEIKIYNMLQYDLLFGENYLENEE